MDIENQKPIIQAHSLEVKRHKTSQAPHQIWTYEMLDQRQKQIAAQVEKGSPGALLLSEVAPVITLGKRMKKEELSFSPEEYEKKGIQIYATERGGFGTYHGPGQWVLFPVDSLKALTGDTRGVQKIVDALLELAKTVSLNFVDQVEIKQGRQLGLWTPQGKLASIGIQVQNGVVLHGLSINVFATEQSFYGLNPCGLDAKVDYLLRTQSDENQKEVFFKKVFDSLLDESLMYLWV